MKKILLFSVLITLKCYSYSQVSGNANYQVQIKYPDNYINVNLPQDADLHVSVKGLANIKADAYVAIFNITQTGNTAEEVNSLVEERIAKITEKLKEKNFSLMIDMISFVPIYAYEAEKKLFSKRTYNEIPAGFELKKNLHIKYTTPNDLNYLIALLAGAEIYDLIRVDYFSSNLEKTKKDLMIRSKEILMDKLKTYSQITGIKIDSSDLQLADGYKVVVPVESYRSYQAYSNSSLKLNGTENVNQVNKATTLYYQPVIDKEFDFVINPVILEPVIQVLYEIKIRVKPKEKISGKEYILITKDGNVKSLSLE